MTAEPQSYEPLLEPGVHTLTLSRIEALCVERFPNSFRRPLLMDRFRDFHEIVCRLDRPMSIWLDGSFLSTKTDPGDIDVVLFASNEAIESAEEHLVQEVAHLLENRAETKARFLVDLYYCSPDDEARKRYWFDTFGTDRRQSPKGIAELLVGNHPND